MKNISVKSDLFNFYTFLAWKFFLHVYVNQLSQAILPAHG